jgi:hypothetical protein
MAPTTDLVSIGQIRQRRRGVSMPRAAVALSEMAQASRLIIQGHTGRTTGPRMG